MGSRRFGRRYFSGISVNSYQLAVLKKMKEGLKKLEIYKLSVRLEIFLYKVLDCKFPKEEKYRSIDQLKRSSSSVVNNIAEAYGRYSFGSKIHHLFIARGEIEETISGVERAYYKNFISKQMREFIVGKYTELIRKLNSFINFLKEQKQLTDN